MGWSWVGPAHCARTAETTILVIVKIEKQVVRGAGLCWLRRGECHPATPTALERARDRAWTCSGEGNWTPLKLTVTPAPPERPGGTTRSGWPVLLTASVLPGISQTPSS